MIRPEALENIRESVLSFSVVTVGPVRDEFAIRQKTGEDSFATLAWSSLEDLSVFVNLIERQGCEPDVSKVPAGLLGAS